MIVVYEWYSFHLSRRNTYRTRMETESRESSIRDWDEFLPSNWRLLYQGSETTTKWIQMNVNEYHLPISQMVSALGMRGKLSVFRPNWQQVSPKFWWVNKGCIMWTDNMLDLVGIMDFRSKCFRITRKFWRNVFLVLHMFHMFK